LPVSGEVDNLVGEIGKIQSIAISQNRDKMWEIMFDDRSDAPLALTFTETSFLGINDLKSPQNRNSKGSVV